MKIHNISCVNFERRLKASEEAEYSDVLKRARNKCIGDSTGENKFILIVPSTSLPNKTGVGNLNSAESLDFFEFAKKYWGINESQILPIGQYHNYGGEYPIYSGTSMDLGVHVIDIEKYASKHDLEEIIKNNKIKNHVNFANVIDENSSQNKILKKLYDSKKYEKEFEIFKKNNAKRLESKALYRVLREINNSYNYNNWSYIDKNLYNRDIVSEKDYQNRVNEIKAIKSKEIDFYYFKQYLAEDSLKKARKNLNQKGIKLNGDMLCGFSFDEVWAHPKAFIPNTTIGWNLPALDLDSNEGIELLKEKTRFYAERFDGIRMDASWTYINQPNIKNGIKNTKYYEDKILNIIEDEIKKIKGDSWDLKNIMHEFAASKEDFDIYDGYSLKPFVKNRVKIYTSDYLNENWGSNQNFLERGWNNDSFVIGARNHDSKKINPTQEQIEALSKIFKIPAKKLADKKEFIKAKLAEPFNAKYSMIYFADALNIDQQFQGNENKSLNYAVQIPLDYQDKYFSSLEKGEGFNPMDALEKSFKAKGFDKTEPDLYKKIVKYKKILEQKEKQTYPVLKLISGLACLGLIIYLLFKSHKSKPTK